MIYSDVKFNNNLIYFKFPKNCSFIKIKFTKYIFNVIKNKLNDLRKEEIKFTNLFLVHHALFFNLVK